MRNAQNKTFACSLFAAMLFTCGLAGSSFAAINGDYNVMLGESPRYLDAIVMEQRGEITASELYVIKYEESCKNPSIRLQDRNRPAFLVQNTSALGQANSVSSFIIDITQAGYAFGTGDPGVNDGFNGSLILPNVRTDPGVTMTANLVANDPTKLQVNFNGLTQGKFALFRLDLDPSPDVAAAFPDYRGILLGANIGQGATSPATIQATFTQPGENPVTTNAVAFNGNIPGTVQSGLLEVYHAQSRTDMFDMDGGTVPEPATISLIALAGMGLLGRRCRLA